MVHAASRAREHRPLSCAAIPATVSVAARSSATPATNCCVSARWVDSLAINWLAITWFASPPRSELDHFSTGSRCVYALSPVIASS